MSDDAAETRQRCRWKEVRAEEDCRRWAETEHVLCREHVDTAIGLVRGRVPPRERDGAVDRFIGAVIGAAGAAVVEHFDVVMRVILDAVPLKHLGFHLSPGADYKAAKTRAHASLAIKEIKRRTTPPTEEERQRWIEKRKRRQVGSGE